MRVKLAQTAGFCMGVRRAVESAQDAASQGQGQVYTLGPIIHNQQAVEALAAKGVETLDQVPEEMASARIVIRAHGVPKSTKQTLQDQGHEIIDATCPHVLASQRRIEKACAEGREIVLVGDRDHAEMVGLAGHADTPVHIISSLKEAQKLTLKAPYCVIAQTTFSAAEYAAICDEFSKRDEDTLIHQSICSATSDRQNEVRELANECDAVVVVGGKHSANTCRLAELAKESGKPVFHVEHPDELDITKLADLNLVGVTAGASTPGWLTQTVIDRLNSIHSGGAGSFLRLILNVAVRSYLYCAASAVGLLWAITRCFGGTMRAWQPVALVFSYIFSIYICNRYADRAQHEQSISSASFDKRFRLPLLLLASCMTLASLVLAWSIRPDLLALLAIAYGGGALYTVRLLPKTYRYRRMKDLPASKDLFVAFAWAIVLPGTAAATIADPSPVALIGGTLLTFLLVLGKTVALDLRDTEGDRLVGTETIPVLLGKRRTVRILYSVQLAVLLLLGGLVTTSVFPMSVLLFCVIPLYGLLYLKLFRKGLLTEETLCQVVVDGQFLLAGLLALALPLLPLIGVHP